MLVVAASQEWRAVISRGAWSPELSRMKIHRFGAAWHVTNAARLEVAHSHMLSAAMSCPDAQTYVLRQPNR